MARPERQAGKEKDRKKKRKKFTTQKKGKVNDRIKETYKQRKKREREKLFKPFSHIMKEI